MRASCRRGSLRSMSVMCGLDVLRWSDSPAELPTAAAGTVLILAEPSEPPGEVDRKALASYLENGGRVLFCGSNVGAYLKAPTLRHAVMEWSQRLGLESWRDSMASEFSHGMRQKASIALALVRPFSILLADEPFDGLDPPSREVLFELLKEAREGGAAVVVSTHRGDVVGAADRCLALRDGRLAYDGPPDEAAIAEFFDAV